MRKKLILVGILILVQLTSKAQFITHSAEGKGTVVTPLNGMSVSIDIGESEIAFGANNYSKALNKSNKRPFNNWFYGANLAAKNSSGIGNLISDGKISPAANLQGFLGFNINNNAKLIENWEKSKWKHIAQTVNDRRKRLVDGYRKDIIGIIIESAEKIVDSNFKASTKLALKDSIANHTPDGLALNVQIALIKGLADVRLKEFVKVFKDLQAVAEAVYMQKYNDPKAEATTMEIAKEFARTNKVFSLTPFLFGGLEGRSFSYFTGTSAISLAKSFTDTLTKGKLIGFGINLQRGSFWFGLTYSFISGDNFTTLTNKEYTLRTTDNLNNQALISEKKITSYSGNYARVKNNQLNIDLIKEFELSDTARIITNVYYRASMFSRNKDYLPNISSTGLGLYFLGAKAKFIGGLYVELPDLANNLEKSKPVLEQDIRSPLKKLTFGITTKFAIASVFGFTNRPKTAE